MYPDPACHFDTDSVPACNFDADTDPYSDPDPYPYPTFHFDTDPDPDPRFQIKAQNLEIMLK